MACFADINVSQGSVATHARCGGIFNQHLTTNLPKNLPVKKILNPLRFDRIVIMSLWPRFLAHPIGGGATSGCLEYIGLANMGVVLKRSGRTPETRLLDKDF